MNIKEQLKKLYNKLNYFTDGLINRIIAAFGLIIALTGLIDLISGPIEKRWMTTIIFSFVSILVGLCYIIIKPISIFLASKFKIPTLNANIYIVAGILVTIYDWNQLLDLQSNLTLFEYIAIIAFLLKTPFLPECKLKTFQEILEKIVIIISLIAFIISFMITIKFLINHFIFG